MTRKILLAGASTFALAFALPALADPSGPNADIGQNTAGTVIDNDVRDNKSLRNNAVTDSYNNAAGVAHAQQNNGNANSINAATSVQADIVQGFVPIASGATVNSNTNNNNVTHIGNNDPAVVDRSNAINNSFGGFGVGQSFSGVATTQQNNGDVNEMGAATAVYATLGQQLDDISQGSNVNGTSFQNGGFESDEIQDVDSVRDNSVNGSFGGAQGTSTSQQNNGNANAIGAATTVAVHGSTLGSVNSFANAFGSVTENAVLDKGLARSNSINDSYTGALGSHTNQQNNGDANVMGAAATVVVGLDPNAPIGMNGAASLAALGSLVAGNVVDSVLPGSTRSNTILASYVGAQGLMQQQQNNGNANVIGSAVNVAIRLPQ